jgi:hypothetical protein
MLLAETIAFGAIPSMPKAADWLSPCWRKGAQSVVPSGTCERKLFSAGNNSALDITSHLDPGLEIRATTAPETLGLRIMTT